VTCRFRSAEPGVTMVHLCPTIDARGSSTGYVCRSGLRIPRRFHSGTMYMRALNAPLFALAEQRPRRGVMAQASTLDNVHTEGV
jgi:hypothetical protein